MFVTGDRGGESLLMLFVHSYEPGEECRVPGDACLHTNTGAIMRSTSLFLYLPLAPTAGNNRFAAQDCVAAWVALDATLRHTLFNHATGWII